MKKFCSGCGTARNESARFCAGCGMQFSKDSTPVQQKSPVEWQIVVGNQLPSPVPAKDSASSDINSEVEPESESASESDLAEESPESLRGRAWNLLFLTSMDFISAYASQAPGAVENLPLRAGTLGAACFFGMIAGSSRGFFSLLMGIASLGLSFLQGISIYQLVEQLSGNPEILGESWMNMVTQSIAMIVAFNAFRACRR